MKQARLYETPEQFAEMMMGRLSEGLGACVAQRGEEPLLLEIQMDSGRPEEKAVISLHDVYHTYMASGDLNIAVEHLNNVIRTSNFTRSMQDRCILDTKYIYPAVRNERYVEEAGGEYEFLSDAFLPGLRIVYLEIKDEITKIINKSLLEQNPVLNEENVRTLAFANLKAAGWQKPRMRLKVPFRMSCTVDVYMEHPHPIECQFLLPAWKRHMPTHCVIAFTNRMTMMVMHSTERMDTLERAMRLVEKTRFRDVVKRSVHFMPGPVSPNIYWVHNGAAQLMEGC